MKKHLLVLLAAIFLSSPCLFADWNQKVSLYQEELPGMNPQLRAARWLDLATQPEASQKDGLELLIKALPPSESWPLLAQLLFQRDLKQIPEDHVFALRFLVATLNNDEAGQWQALTPMVTREPRKAAVEKNDPRPSPALIQKLFQALIRFFFPEVSREILLFEDFSYESYGITGLTSDLLSSSDNPENIEKGIRLILEKQKSLKTYHTRLEVPDLVTLLGEERSKVLLTEILQTPGLTFQINVGQSTRKLAQELAIENIDLLTQPCWDLACSLDGGELYEALDKRFPGKGHYEKNQALFYYLYGLVAKGSSEKAAEVFNQMIKEKDSDSTLYFSHYRAMQDLESSGHSREIYRLLTAALQKEPTLPFWDLYIPMATRLGHGKEVIALLEKTSRQKDVVQATEGGIYKHLFQAYLASGKMAEAASTYQIGIKYLTTSSGKKSAEHASAIIGQWSLANALLKNKTEFALAVADGNALLKSGKLESYSKSSFVESLSQSLLENGQTSEAEALMQKSLQSLPVPERYLYFYDQSPESILISLATFYYLQNQPQKLMDLLARSIHWNAGDLALILHKSTNPEDAPVGFLAAWALHHTAKSGEAEKILHALIRQGCSYDPAFSLLLDITQPDAALKLLDEAFSYDAFEERPLIWKAELLRREGKTDQALTTIKKAVAIDPSDGEIGPGRRMTAYRIWGKIAQDQRDASTVTLMQNVDKAIRLAERADRFQRAGLIARSIAMYEESLNFFADAYCIQSRLATKLADQGRWEEARAHYQRAFELMPDSFGRMESHCFGCERAFGGPGVETLAESVFTRLIRAQPGKPQLHYLLGYLRKEHQRYPEALTHFQKAAELDPDYLSAWKQMIALKGNIHLSRSSRDAATLTLLRLDPLKKHTHPNLQEVCDLPALWKAVEKRRALLTPHPDQLWPLPAAARFIGEKKETLSEHEKAFQKTYRMNDHYGLPESGVEAVLRQSQIQKLLELNRNRKAF